LFGLYRIIISRVHYRLSLLALIPPSSCVGHPVATDHTISERTGNGKQYW